MNEKRYSITLADGSALENLMLNGNNFISVAEVTSDTFKGKLSPVVISDGETEEVHPYMDFVQVMKMPSGYWFVLIDVSPEEVKQRNFEAGIRFMAAKTLSDKDAFGAVAIFPAWSAFGTSYHVGDRVQHQNKLWKCLQAHTSQADWTPDTAVSLWVRMDDPSIEWPEWIQPVGAHDSYAKGAKVAHNGKKWVSDVDSNVWEPGVNGWSEQATE